MTKRERVEITPDIRAKLNEEHIRTGQGGSALMHGKRGEYPQGLKSQMIDRWRAGTLATAKPEHLEWVLSSYREWTPQPPKPESKKLTITPDLHKQLLAEVGRTGLGAIAILKHAPKPMPNGLNHQKVQRWITSRTQSANEEHFNFVLAVYRSF